MQIVVPNALDTDQLGTFTGEIEQPAPPRATALLKARLGIKATGLTASGGKRRRVRTAYCNPCGRIHPSSLVRPPRPRRDVLEIGELPDPQPSAGEVRIRVHACAINPTGLRRRT